MARKLFGMIEAGKAGIVDKTAGPETGSLPSGRITTVNRLSTGLMDLSNNSVRDIPLDAIHISDVRDRLTVQDDGISELAEAIRKHGQIVPIMVRPLHDQPDRYQIIYGRRRLAAIRSLGGRGYIKAIVRNVPDEEAIVAQGQENSLRLDPSYIEKALFARDLQQQDYSITVIGEALNIDRYEVSKLVKVVEDLGDDVITLIGPAHQTGRRPWRELGDLLLTYAGNRLEAVREVLATLPPGNETNDRFRLLIERLRRHISVAPELRAQPGAEERLAPGPTTRLVGRIEVDAETASQTVPPIAYRSTPRQISLTFDRRATPEFCEWIDQNIDQIAEELQSRWIASRPPES
jgi:ParB family chromosome partitioning protein